MRPEATPQRGRTCAPALTASEFAARFDESYRVLWLIAVGITRDSGLAEDVVQDAAVIALRKLDDFEPGSNFNAWMGQTVRYVAYNASRKENKRRIAAIDPAEIDQGAAGWTAATPALRVGPRGELAANQEHFDDQLVAALNSVSETARACLLLRTLADMEYSEISAVLHIPEGTAMSHVHRTRRLLRERIAGPGFAEAPRAEA